MVRLRRWSIAITAFVLGAAAASCVAPQRAEDVAVFASGADLESANPLVTIHPLSRQVQRHMLFVPLARYGADLAPEPYGARSWTWSADRRRVTLALETSLRWHDGRPTTAHDAVFTLNAARDPAVGYMRSSDLASVVGAVAIDDSTLVIDFSAPQADLPLVLCELPVLPRHLLGSVAPAGMRAAAFNLAPVGNGPFRFVERVAGQRWRFARNDAFPPALGGPPRLAGVVVAVVDEATTKFAGLASGELDVAGISPTMAALAARDPSLRVVSYPVLFTTALVFNTGRAPFDDMRVRRAIDLSIDRERIVRAAVAGYATVAASPAPPENPLALDVAPRRSPAEADSLLDAAGWRRGSSGELRAKGGRPLRVELLTVGSGDNAVEQLLQADLAERGVRLDIRQVELGTMLSEARAQPRRFDLLYTGIPGDLSLAYLSAMFDSRQAGGALDYAGFHTPRLDSLFAAARAADANAAPAAWHRVQQELLTHAPVSWIYHARGVQGVARRLRNVEMDLRGELATVARWDLAPLR